MLCSVVDLICVSIRYHVLVLVLQNTWPEAILLALEHGASLLFESL